MGGSDALVASRLGSIAFKLSFTTGETEKKVLSVHERRVWGTRLE